MVSEDVVRKLSLKMKKSSKIKVSRHALVSLSISTTYKDAIYYDIIPMDGYHILLGPPWQFDWNVVHNGKNNTHSFYFKNRKITLLPSKDLTCANRSPPSDSKPAMFLSRSCFETELYALSHVVNGCVLCYSLDLTILSNRSRLSSKAIDFITDLQHIHKLTYDHLVASVAKYKITTNCHRHHVEFEVGDKVLVVLIKDHFLLHNYNRLKGRKTSPLKVLHKSTRMHTAFDFLTAFIHPMFSMSSIGFPLLTIQTNQIQGRIFSNPMRMMEHKIRLKPNIWFKSLILLFY